jgi:serine/threonine protein phosphatase PrpC
MQIYEHVITESTEFIIMASDGLWDIIKNQDAVNFVRRQLFEHSTIERAAQELLAKAIEKGSSDNISVQIVCLNQAIGSDSAGSSNSDHLHTMKGGGKLSGRKRTGPQCTTQ